MTIRQYDFRTPDFINITVGGITRQIHAGTDYDAVITGVPTVVGEDKGRLVRLRPTRRKYSVHSIKQ